MRKRRRRKRESKPHYDVEAATRALKLGADASVDEFASDAQIRLLIKLGVRQSKASRMTKHEAHRTIDRMKVQQGRKRQTPKARTDEKIQQVVDD